MICTVAYLFLRGQIAGKCPLVSVAQWIKHLNSDCTFFVGRSSNPTSEYNFHENIFLYFLFPTNLFNVLAGTTPSLLQSVT